MKSFQDWLDCQTYASHLRILTQIKQESHSLQASQCMNRNLKTAVSFHDISNLKKCLDHKPKSSYLQNSLKQKQIQRENISFATRILKVSPVISANKQIRSYHKSQSIIKRNCSSGSFGKIRQQKLKDFMTIGQESNMKRIYKAIVKLKFISIPEVNMCKNTTFWLQVFSERERAVSGHYNSQQILGSEIEVGFNRRLKKELKLIFHCSKGLNYRNMGEYCIEVYDKREAPETFISVSGDHKIITIQMQIIKLYQKEATNQSSERNERQKRNTVLD